MKLYTIYPPDQLYQTFIIRFEDSGLADEHIGDAKRLDGALVPLKSISKDGTPYAYKRNFYQNVLDDSSIESLTVQHKHPHGSYSYRLTRTMDAWVLTDVGPCYNLGVPSLTIQAPVTPVVSIEDLLWKISLAAGTLLGYESLEEGLRVQVIRFIRNVPPLTTLDVTNRLRLWVDVNNFLRNTSAGSFSTGYANDLVLFRASLQELKSVLLDRSVPGAAT